MTLVMGGGALPNEGRPQPPYPATPWWRPDTWIRLLVWHWRCGGEVKPLEGRGYWFWIPTVALILTIELLGALSSRFDNWIPWPTISDTVGHLEKRWDWLAVVVLGLIAVVAFHVVAYRGGRSRTTGRARRRRAPPAKRWDWYGAPFVVAVTVVAILMAVVFNATKYEYGYVIYGVLFGVGVVIPSILSFWANRLVGFPTLFFTIDRLRRRLHSVALVLVARADDPRGPSRVLSVA